MGLFWDLLQQSQLSDQSARTGRLSDRATQLEGRVRYLEEQLRNTQTLLHEVIKRLETIAGEDLNRDGRIG